MPDAKARFSMFGVLWLNKKGSVFSQMYWKLIQLVLLAALKETTAQVDPVIINDYPGHSECVYLA